MSECFSNLQSVSDSNLDFVRLKVNRRNELHKSSKFFSCKKILPFGVGDYIYLTGTDQLMRYGMEPVMFTMTLLNQSTRNNPNSWKRHLDSFPTNFYYYALFKSSKASKAKNRSQILGKGQYTRTTIGACQ